MKKLTAKEAQRLSKQATTKASTFQDVLDLIVANSKLGLLNCFIDGKLEDLKVISQELTERGFVCHVRPKYIEVEWYK